MERRKFLELVAAMLATATAPVRLAAAEPRRLSGMFDPYFLQLVQGFLLSARGTAPGFAVCDFPQGTLLKGCLTPSGKSYVSVARMLPLLSEWYAAGKEPRTFTIEGDAIHIEHVILEIFRNAFDPQHPHYWGEPPSDKPTQRSVEAALVADALSRVGDPLLGQLTSRERSNIQRWLASCTTFPERTTNHAWFTCLNQSVRLRLSERWPEFSGDEEWMLADLKALDALFIPGPDGWYSDWPKIPIYDYYNFWTFANFPLLWSRMIGSRYPEWSERFRSRVRLFLQTAPYFFAPDGSHPWFGRSLIYRWAVLSPLVLGYQQGIWPHSPGLLRRIVRANLEFYWKIGSFDPELGKLRETLSAEGTPDVRESYIDNGHPYWATLGMMMYSIPAADPFWTEPEEPLPVERGDFAVRFEGPRMLVAGTQASGHVRWLQARNEPKFPRYRDKYNKFVASSHFPFNILEREDRCPWDQTLVFRNRTTGVCAGRIEVVGGELLADGVETVWRADLDGREFEVRSRIRLLGDFEERTHGITVPAGVHSVEVEILEGSHALGLQEDESFEDRHGESWRCIRSRRSGHCLVTWKLAGYEKLNVAEWFEETKRTRVNIIYPRMAVNTLIGRVPEQVEFASLHYASPRPMELEAILRRGEELAAGWRAAQICQPAHLSFTL